MNAHRRVLAALLAAVAASTPIAAQRTAPELRVDLERFDAYVTRAVRDWGVTGLAIAVVKGDSVVFARGYGVRELGKSESVDAGTRFAIGSTTKAMTAAVLGMLVDDGKLGWDDPVIEHLPGFRLSDPYVTREVTVRDLLTHRAGLGNADLLWAGADYDAAEIVRRIRTLPLAYSFRSDFVYQNIMYAVAGDVVQAASGMPWETFLGARIFEPLGMTATEPTLAGLAGQPNVATPHAEIDDTLRVISNRTVDPVKAAGSIWSSVSDMAKWMRFILDSGRVDGKRLLSDSVYTELLSPQVIADPAIYPTMTVVDPHFFTYGLGWFLHDYDGQAVAMHTGSIDGMSAIIGLIPDRRLGVYVLANTDHAELRHALMYRVFDLFSGNPPRDWSAELLELYGERRDEARAEAREREAGRDDGTDPSLPLERYAGTYTNATFGDVIVTAARSNGALHLEYGGRREGDLTHWEFDTFRAHWSDVRLSPSSVVFMPDGAGIIGAVRAFGITFARAEERR
ncbi:MAG: serine hydrolase [Gemmatimonadaceae bacterium]